jgi:hypothetical protein
LTRRHIKLLVKVNPVNMDGELAGRANLDSVFERQPIVREGPCLDLNQLAICQHKRTDGERRNIRRWRARLGPASRQHQPTLRCLYQITRTPTVIAWAESAPEIVPS